MMRSRTPVSLFPFLSVLLSTMGVLGFLAVTFMLLVSAAPVPEEQAQPEPVEVRWVGAPEHVRPLLVECRGDAVVLHEPGGGQRRFTRSALQTEVNVVKQVVERGYESLGPTPQRTDLWLFLKSTLPGEERLSGSFTMALHEVEIGNLRGPAQEQRIERYPILLIYPDGVATYELASYLVETTTRLSMGLEPMLEDWELPYRNVGA